MTSPVQFSISSEITQKLAGNTALKDSVAALGEEIEQIFSSKLNALIQQHLKPQEAAASAAVQESVPPPPALSSAAFAKVQPAISLPTSLSGHEFRNGNFGIQMHADGERVETVTYYSDEGVALNKSGFHAPSILRAVEQFGLDMNDLTGLGEQLDAAGVGYRPYELYKNTGSDHGIDFNDLINGGMGTAYDWTVDPLVDLKGPSARMTLRADQELAERLGVRFGAATGNGAEVNVVDDAAASRQDQQPVQPAEASTIVGVVDSAENVTASSTDVVAEELTKILESVINKMLASKQFDFTTAMLKD